MKKHSIPSPKRTSPSNESSLVPFTILPCVEEEKIASPSDGCVKNVEVSFAAGATVSIGENT
ncbi:MAG: hypothetical protein LBU51_09505 [Bacteroidales bacterium]|nr:hypothetical protein [Bacteroidales bacterium]